MRRWTFAGLVVAFVLSASSASAISSIHMIWKHNGLPDANVCGTSCGPGPGPGNGAPATVFVSGYITALIVLEGDSVGVGGVFVSILFDTLELDFISALEHSGPATNYGRGRNFQPLVAGVTVDEAAGVISGFDSAAGLQSGCIDCTITLGSVIFHIAMGDESYEPADVVATVLPNGIAGVVYAGRRR